MVEGILEYPPASERYVDLGQLVRNCMTGYTEVTFVPAESALKRPILSDELSYETHNLYPRSCVRTNSDLSDTVESADYIFAKRRKPAEEIARACA